MLLFNLATCVRVMQRKNSKQYITRQKNSLIESDLEIDNIHNQRIKIHNRKLYFYDNKPIGFAVAQSVEVQLTEEVREIGFFSNRRVVDAFHLKSDDKKDDKKKEVFKHDRPHRPGDPKVGDAGGNRYGDKPLTRPNYGANGKEPTNTARPGEFGSFDERQTSTRLDPLPPRTYPPLRDRSSDYIYPPSNRYNDNSPHNDPDLPTNRYKDSNDPYADKKYDYPPINNSQNNDKPWYDDYTYDKPNITSLNKPPDYKYERQNSTSLSKQKEDREDKHHSIESDSSYDDDNGYGITKLDVFVEELKNGYFKLSNDKNCLTYFEEKYIFGICIKNDANQEFKVVNVDEALSKLKEEKEKKSDSKPAKLKEVTVTVTEVPKMATTTVTQSKVMTEATDQNKPTASKATPINLSKAIDKHVKPVKNDNVAQVDVEDDKGEDFFDKNSGDLLEALQKNFSFKDMPF